MKKILFLLLLVLSLNSYAQKGVNQFSLFAGYEYFPELWKGDGYNVGVEFKHYLNNRFFALANFHAGKNNGVVHTSYTRDGNDYNFDLSNRVSDYMLGLGLGADLMHIKSHKIYVQGSVGLGSSEQYEDGIVSHPVHDYDMVKQFEEKSVRFAISVSAGYDYQLTDWLSVGVNYTGWQIGYEFKSSANVKLGFIF